MGDLGAERTPSKLIARDSRAREKRQCQVYKAKAKVHYLLIGT